MARKFSFTFVAIFTLTQVHDAFTMGEADVHNGTCLYHWLARAGMPHVNASQYSEALEAAGITEKMINSTLPVFTIRVIMRSSFNDAVALKGCITGKSERCRGYHPCKRGGECVFDLSRITSTCKCRPGLHGDLCEKDDIDCNKKLCSHRAQCRDTFGSYVCTCLPGYRGNGKVCQPVDECLSHPCQNNGKCIDQVNRYSCHCHVGYEGERCEKRWLRTDTHKPLPEALRNISDAVQELTDEMKEVVKILGKQGKNNCPRNVCKNGGQCVDQVDGYLCICRFRYVGQYCEKLSVGTSRFHPASSCQQIYANDERVSGMYWVKGSGNRPVQVYCNMTDGGGWMRVVHIDPILNGCPSVFHYVTSPVHVCALKSGPGCTSAKFGSHGIEYSEVRGYAYGHHYYSTDAFNAKSAGIDGFYVDGVSVTHGSPRKHIWTFAVGLSQNYSYSTFNCPCGQYPGPNPPSFVGNDYYCESGMKGSLKSNRHWSTERLWDGHCYSKSKCCDHSGMPYFEKTVASTSSDDLEVRICQDEETSGENTGVEKMEIFVR